MLIFLQIDKDKDKAAFIGPKEFFSHMMMAQTKEKLDLLVSIYI